jgi:hypothetical protein
MSIYLTITIDVEPDCSPTWHYSNPLTFDGVKIGIREKLQPLFNRYGFPPTYLINNVVLENKESAKILSSLEGDFELGTHLHSEFIEPEKRFSNYAGVKAQVNQCDFSPEIERAKLKNITDLFIQCFNRRPLSFRAGRFSACNNTIRCLRDLGYRVDTSVVPHITWTDNTQHGPEDYSQALDQPYFVEESLIHPINHSQILEVPVSIKPIKRFLRPERIYWLRPHFSDYNQLVTLTKTFIRNNRRKPITVLNMMFHNVEVLPGKSRRCQTEEECREYLLVLDAYLRYCQKKGIKGIKLSGLYDVYSQNK